MSLWNTDLENLILLLFLHFSVKILTVNFLLYATLLWRHILLRPSSYPCSSVVFQGHRWRQTVYGKGSNWTLQWLKGQLTFSILNCKYYSFRCLGNILVVKIPKIMACNPPPPLPPSVQKNMFCGVIDREMSRFITCYLRRVTFVSSVLGITDGSKLFKIASYKKPYK